jgi:hypothetical protein
MVWMVVKLGKRVLICLLIKRAEKETWEVRISSRLESVIEYVSKHLAGEDLVPQAISIHRDERRLQIVF